MATILIAIAVVVLLLVLGFNILSLGLSILWMLLIGLVIGALARLVVPGRQEMGMLMTALIGAAGALVGGLLASELLDVGTVVEFLVSVAVAAVFVMIAAGIGSGRGDTLDRT